MFFMKLLSVSKITLESAVYFVMVCTQCGAQCHIFLQNVENSFVYFMQIYHVLAQFVLLS